MAMEDAASLAYLISQHGDLGTSVPLFNGYEGSRKSRCESIVNWSALNGYYNHLPDGAEQQNRDTEQSRADWVSYSSDWPWLDADIQRVILTWDVYAECKQTHSSGG